MTEVPTKSMPWWRYGLLWVALAVSAVSQWYIFQQTEWYWSSWGLSLGGLIAAFALGRPEPLALVASWPAPASPGRREKIRGFLTGLLGLVAAVAGVAVLSISWQTQFAVGWSLLLGGVALWSIGLGGIDHSWRKLAPEVPWLGWEKVLFFAVVAIGLFLRFYRYDYFPPPDGVCAVEEPQSGQGAMVILQGYRPWEFMLDRWLPLIGMQTIGHSFTAIRIPFTIVSWLTIIPLYLLMRELMSRPAALFGTLLFAICRWHLFYARLAHAVFGPTLPLILLILYLCARVYRRGGLALYPWIGLLSAYTLYTYAGYRATPAFVGLFFVISLIHHLWVWRRAADPAVATSVRRSFGGQLFGGGLAGIAFFMMLVPLYFQLTYNPMHFVEAAVRATDDPGYYTTDPDEWWRQRVSRIQSTAMMFSHFGDGSATFNEPGTPQLDPVSGTLMVIGLAYCVIWGLSRFQGFFAFYFLVILAFGTVFVHNFDIRRLQGIIPLIFIMIGYAADRFGKVTLARFGERAKGALVGLAVVVAGLAFYDNYRVYFVNAMNNPIIRAAFHNGYTVLVSYLHKLPDNSYMLVVSDIANLFLPSDFEWVRGDRIPGRTSNDLHALLTGQNGPWRGRELHVMIQQPFYEGEEIAQLIQTRFPTATCGEYLHSDKPVFATFTACKIPPQPDGGRLEGGIRARYFRGDSTKPFLERNEPAISFGLLPDACRVPKADGKPICRVEWEGAWQVEKAGEYTVVGDIRRGELKISVDDAAMGVPAHAKVATDQTVQKKLMLTEGPHRVRVEAKFGNMEYIGARLRVRRGPEDPLQLVPFGRLIPPATE